MGLLDDAIREHLDLKRARGADPAEIERMEREALGPVRRGPVASAERLDPSSPSSRGGRAPGYDDPAASQRADYGQHPTDLEDLQELGYHDSTAPHHYPGHEDERHDFAGPEQGVGQAGYDEADPWAPATREPSPPPKRRFLRRGRRTEEPGPSHDAGPGTAPHTQFEDADPQYHAAAPAPPPLEFNHPPKRPSFSPEPPSVRDSQPTNSDWPAEGLYDETRAQPAEHDREDAQETTEFDVERHLAASPPLDEDVLEETPEFLQDTPEHDRLWFEQRPPRDFDFDG